MAQEHILSKQVEVLRPFGLIVDKPFVTTRPGYKNTFSANVITPTLKKGSTTVVQFDWHVNSPQYNHAVVILPLAPLALEIVMPRESALGMDYKLFLVPQAGATTVPTITFAASPTMILPEHIPQLVPASASAGDIIYYEFTGFAGRYIVTTAATFAKPTDVVA